MAAQGIICQGCGIEAPSKYVEFHQNVGMVVMRQSSAIRGNLCKKCIHSQFWKKTLVTVGIGWLGTISFIIAPIFVIMNLVRYLGAMGLEGVPTGAIRPQLTEAAISAVHPHVTEVVQRINGGEPIESVARDLATRTGVTPGQVILYVRALAQSSQSAPAPAPTYGFPVQAARAVPPPIPARVQPIAAIPLES